MCTYKCTYTYGIRIGPCTYFNIATSRSAWCDDDRDDAIVQQCDDTITRWRWSNDDEAMLHGHVYHAIAISPWHRYRVLAPSRDQLFAHALSEENKYIHHVNNTYIETEKIESIQNFFDNFTTIGRKQMSRGVREQFNTYEYAHDISFWRLFLASSAFAKKSIARLCNDNNNGARDHCFIAIVASPSHCSTNASSSSHRWCDSEPDSIHTQCNTNYLPVPVSNLKCCSLK